MKIYDIGEYVWGEARMLSLRPEYKMFPAKAIAVINKHIKKRIKAIEAGVKKNALLKEKAKLVVREDDLKRRIESVVNAFKKMKTREAKLDELIAERILDELKTRDENAGAKSERDDLRKSDKELRDELKGLRKAMRSINGRIEAECNWWPYEDDKYLYETGCNAQFAFEGLRRFKFCPHCGRKVNVWTPEKST